MFAKQVKLNYKGKDSFKTLFGGCVSFVIFATIIVYTTFLINQIIHRKGSNTTLSTEIKNLQSDPEVHRPGLGSLRIAVSYVNLQDKPFYDETYFRFTMNEYELVRNDSNHITLTNQRDLEPVLCDEELFHNNSIWFMKNNSAMF